MKTTLLGVSEHPYNSKEDEGSKAQTASSVGGAVSVKRNPRRWRVKHTPRAGRWKPLHGSTHLRMNGGRQGNVWWRVIFSGPNPPVLAVCGPAMAAAQGSLALTVWGQHAFS